MDPKTQPTHHQEQNVRLCTSTKMPPDPHRRTSRKNHEGGFTRQFVEEEDLELGISNELLNEQCIGHVVSSTVSFSAEECRYMREAMGLEFRHNSETGRLVVAESQAATEERGTSKSRKRSRSRSRSASRKGERRENARGSAASDDNSELHHRLYRAYGKLKERGYVVRSGMKFGSHYLIYRGNPNPARNRAVALAARRPQAAAPTSTAASAGATGGATPSSAKAPRASSGQRVQTRFHAESSVLVVPEPAGAVPEASPTTPASAPSTRPLPLTFGDVVAKTRLCTTVGKTFTVATSGDDATGQALFFRRWTP